MIVSYNWLKDYLGEGTTVTAATAAELLGAHAFEIEEVYQVGADTVIDVDILPNRSSDCLSHRGIARELASITGVPLAHDPLATTPELTMTDHITVSIADPSACPRFTASLITDVEVKDSPDWLKARLEAIGQRPINNIVDATNYVMYAIGQPLHAYDADLFPQVNGTWQFAVRFARPGEQVSLIPEGGKTEERVIECVGTEQLIVDASSDTPIGLAGVKGGSFAGVHAGTTRIIIEAAHFHPTVTRKTARRLGIVIDASKRFENEPSRELPPYGQAEIIALIKDIAGGKYVGTVEEYVAEKPIAPVDVSVLRTNALLGLSLPKNKIVELILQTGSVVSDETGADTISCTGPFERSDLHIEEDFIEEVGRLYGYEHVASVVPQTVSLSELNARHYYSERVREKLCSLGFNEVITSSFRKKDQLQLRNALASDKSYLRSNLQKNIGEVLDKNAGFSELLGTQDTRVFEIGTVFTKADSGVAEHVSLALGVRLKQSGYSNKEDSVVKEATAAIQSLLDIDINWDIAQGVAEVNFSELLNRLPAPTAYEPVTVEEEIVYQPFSIYQHMSRDIALWVGEGVTRANVQGVLEAHAGPLRTRTTFLDEFEKDGRTSYAFRLVFQSDEKTLTDEEVNEVMESITTALSEEGWEVR